MTDSDSDLDEATTIVYARRPGAATRAPAGSRRPAGGLWGPREVASFLGVSRSWVYQKSEEGLLPVIRMPGSSLLRFDPTSVEAYARGEWTPPKTRAIPPSRSRP
jgi:excisionase family DNA binding protein